MNKSLLDCASFDFEHFSLSLKLRLHRYFWKTISTWKIWSALSVALLWVSQGGSTDETL